MPFMSITGKAQTLATKRSSLGRSKLKATRGFVILLVSFLEDALLERILKALPHGEKLKRSLLRGGSLRSIEHRMVLAQALGLMTDGDAAIFDVFREMRNACAHSRQEISFKTPELVQALGLILAPDTRREMKMVPPSALKLSFEMCAGFMFARLSGESHEHALDSVNKAIRDATGEDLPPLMGLQKASPEKPKGKSAPDRRSPPNGKKPRRPR